MKVVAYIQVSTESQVNKGLSQDIRERACLVKAQELIQPGDDVVVLREVYSELHLERPKLHLLELNRLREWAKIGQLRGIVTYSVNLLDPENLRFLELVGEFEEEGVKLAFVIEPLPSWEGHLLASIRKADRLVVGGLTVGQKVRTERGEMKKSNPSPYPRQSHLQAKRFLKLLAERFGEERMLKCLFFAEAIQHLRGKQQLEYPEVNLADDIVSRGGLEAQITYNKKKRDYHLKTYTNFCGKIKFLEELSTTIQKAEKSE